MKPSLTFTGHKELAAKLRNAAVKYPAVVGAALFRRAEAVMTKSKQNFVPVDLGALMNSGTVSPPKIGKEIVVELSFGGPAAPYALAVHEHLSGASPHSWQEAERQGRPVRFSPAGRGPKYLERPLMEVVRTLAADLAKDINIEKLI